MNLNEPDGAKYLEIVKNGNMDDMFDFGIQIGRVSVLKDFDSMCKADAFVGFTADEWKAVQKFFEFNKQISGWDKELS